MSTPADGLKINVLLKFLDLPLFLAWFFQAGRSFQLLHVHVFEWRRTLCKPIIIVALQYLCSVPHWVPALLCSKEGEQPCWTCRGKSTSNTRRRPSISNSVRWHKSMSRTALERFEQQECMRNVYKLKGKGCLAEGALIKSSTWNTRHFSRGAKE